MLFGVFYCVFLVYAQKKGSIYIKVHFPGITPFDV